MEFRKYGKNIEVLQNNVALFSRLRIAMQSLESDLKEFFPHEMQSFPPSLSDLASSIIRIAEIHCAK